MINTLIMFIKNRFKKKYKFIPDILRLIILFVGIDSGLYSVLWPNSYKFVKFPTESLSKFVCYMCGRIGAPYIIQPYYSLYLQTNIHSCYVCSNSCVVQVLVSTTWLNENNIMNITDENMRQDVNREMTTYWRYNLLTSNKFIITEQKKNRILNMLLKYNVTNCPWMTHNETSNKVVILIK